MDKKAIAAAIEGAIKALYSKGKGKEVVKKVNENLVMTIQVVVVVVVAVKVKVKARRIQVKVRAHQKVITHRNH